jgi:cytochrome c oxidase subunit 4
MTHSTASDSTPHPSVGHVAPFWLLVTIFAALIVLTAVTVAAAQIDLPSYIPIPGLNLYVAMAIAGVKATLVVLFFMHMIWDKPFNRMLFLGCLAFVVLFISGVLTDSHAYRHQIIPGEGSGMKDFHTPLGTPKT